MKLIIQIISIMCWLAFLEGCDTRFIPYLIIGILGVISCCKNTAEHKNFENMKGVPVIFVSSLIFSIMTVSANYYYLGLMIREKGIISYLCDGFAVLMIFAGGFFAAWNILTYLIKVTEDFYWIKVEHRWPAKKIFFLSTVVISAVNSFILFAGYYPGSLSVDSYSSIAQGLQGVYTNHHPFYYTLVVRLFVQLGLKLFGDINAGAAMYSVFQIVFMAACISYVVVTLYQMSVPGKIIMICWVWYVGMPFHIMYSFTMWKDVMFGGFVSVFTVSVYRVLKSIGKYSRLNHIFLMLGSLGMCLFRSNGWFAFLLIYLCFVFLFGENKRGKKVCHAFLAILIFTFILKHPVLHFLNVAQPDTIESLSVPAQQIAMVIRDCDDVRADHIELLNRIVDVNQVPDVYNVHISDPVKELVRLTGNQEYLREHKMEYLILYIEMGMTHLDKYFEAWIDLTKGYWNGGYEYWVWLYKLFENDLGIERTVYLKNIHDGVEEYIWNFYDVPVLQIFLCIGFHVWIVLGTAVLCIIRKDTESFFLTVPVICIVITLLIATPVYAEFRYAYAVFCCIPFIVTAPFHQNDFMLAETESDINLSGAVSEK